MSSEKFLNRPSSTVAVAYTATDLTIEVADASDFPSTGVFRVILGNTEQTIFRVDSVSGDVFTGAAEEFDGDAAIGITVKIVASKEVAERFLQSPSPGELHAYAGVNGADRYLGVVTVTPIDPSIYSWINQGTASVVEAGGSGVITAPNTAGTNVRLRTRTATPPFTVTGCVEPDQIGTGDNEMGLMLRESATGRLYALGYRNGTIMTTILYNSPTALTGIPIDRGGVSSGRRTWFRFVHDGTNISSQYSFDGINFIQLESRSVASTFTTDCDEAGYFVCPRGSGSTQILFCLGLTVEA